MKSRLLRLAIVLGAVGVVWFVALPYVASRPDMEAHLEFLDENGVDPSAMYYTELEMMKPIFERLALENRKAGEP